MLRRTSLMLGALRRFIVCRGLGLSKAVDSSYCVAQILEVTSPQDGGGPRTVEKGPNLGYPR